MHRTSLADAGKLGSVPGWAEFMIERDELDLSHPSAEPFKTKLLKNRIELLKTLDDRLIKSRKALERTTDKHLERPWRFAMGGRILLDAPRYVALQRIALLPHGTPPRTTHGISPLERGHRTRESTVRPLMNTNARRFWQTGATKKG
jgi:hypothetical protein